MLRIIHSYYLRTKRMPIRLLLILLPFAYSLVFITYLRTSPGFSGIETFAFWAIFSILSLFSASFFVGMVYESDKNAQIYANDLRVGISRKKLFLGRFLFILILFFLIELISGLIFFLYLRLSQTAFDNKNFFLMFLINFLGIMPSLVLYQYMNLKYGYTGSLSLAGFLSLASILLGTSGLGNIIWKFFPFTYPIKLIFLLAKGLVKEFQIYKYLTISTLVCIILLWIFSIWFKNWDGQSRMEE